MTEKKPINHGTYGGARVHRRRGEDPCWDCRKAEATYMREWRKANPKGRNREKDAMRASQYARTDLVHAHKDEYDALYTQHLARIRGVEL